MDRFPRFEDEFLENLAFAFRKRRKSLNHRASRAEFAKVYEKIATEAEARLEIDLVKYDGGSLRLWAWPDRHVWLDARRPAKKGWAWEWTHEGRIIGNTPPQLLIAALEETFDLLYELEPASTADLFKPWLRLLANGPKAVR